MNTHGQIRMGRCWIATAIAVLLLMPMSAQAHHGAAREPQRSQGSSGPPGQVTPPVLVIGVAIPFAGGNVGWTQANAVQLAVDQANAAGGVTAGGVTYQLAAVVVDSACNGGNAVAAANTSINAGAVAVVGHACTAASLAAAPVYQAAGMAMVCGSCTGPSLTQQGNPSVFRTVPHDGSPPAMLATAFRNQAGLSRSALVETTWWDTPGDAYQQRFTALGGTLVGRYEVASTSEFTATLATIKHQQPDSILVPMDRQPMGARAEQHG